MMSRYSGRCVGGGWYAVIQKFQSYYNGLVFPKLGNWEVMSGEGSNEYRKMSCYGYLWILEIGCRMSIGLIIKLVSHPKVIECQGNSEHNFPHTVIYLLWTNCPIWIWCHFWCILFLLLVVSIWMRMTDMHLSRREWRCLSSATSYRSFCAVE